MIILNFNKDGTIDTFCPAPKKQLERLFGPLTDKQYKDHIYSRLHEAYSWKREDLVETTAGNLPQDRYFRYAWRADEKKSLKIDINKAREIHMNNIRQYRNQRLEELDKRKYGSEYDDERKALRDLPAAFDLSTATTPEELKALWPEQLKEYKK